MHIAQILLPLPNIPLLDYSYNADLNLQIGDIVIVPFKNQEVNGIVWQINITSQKKLKAVINKAPLEPRFENSLIILINRVSDYYLSQLGSIAKLVLPVDIAKTPLKTTSQLVPLSFNLAPLSKLQEQALENIKLIDKPTLIKGVTGSGKTEIYFHLIKDYLRVDKQVLILLPEIALSQQIIKRFVDRFGFEPVIWNSDITQVQKRRILRGIINNNIKVLVGARSSLFLPYKNLGLIVVDEEHDASYKQEEGVQYNARDVAVLRASISNIKIILCSATPSLETLYNCSIQKYHFVELESRYNAAFMPNIEVVDMRLERLAPKSWLSTKLISAVQETLNRKEQVLIFLNRRGYCPLILCKSCGYRFTCNKCSAWLILHKAAKTLECHHCGFQSKIIEQCPECMIENSLTLCGPGIERIAEEILRLFPQNKIALFSKDQITSSKVSQALLKQVENNEIEILIGTQIITKGYHFPNLTLVGVVDADLGLVGNDFRSSERTFQLLNQVGGRAGREHKIGKVIFQTYYPNNIVLNTLKQNQADQFVQQELANRKQAHMPPFAKMAAIIVVDKDELKAIKASQEIVACAPHSSARILGPAKATMYKLSGRYRYRILITADRKFNLQKYLKVWLSAINISSSSKIKVDIDPQNFY